MELVVEQSVLEVVLHLAVELLLRVDSQVLSSDWGFVSDAELVLWHWQALADFGQPLVQHSGYFLDSHYQQHAHPYSERSFG